MTNPYRYFLARLDTGRVYQEIELVGVSAQRSLNIGGFSAKLDLADDPLDRRIALIDATGPGRTTVVMVRDGVVLGEWIIWKRVRTNDASPVELTGSEVISYLDHRLIGAITYTQWEQFDIAADMFTKAVGGTYPAGLGKVIASVGPYSPSGRVRDRTYTTAEAFIGQRLRELSEVIDGFDYFIDTSLQFDDQSKALNVIRKLQLRYPTAGIHTGRVLFVPGMDTQFGNVIQGGIAEDGTRLASEAWALGGTYNNGGVDTQVIAASANTALITQGQYPYLQASGSWSSVVNQPTIQGHADALLLDRQNIEVPGVLQVVLTPQFGLTDLALGDTFTLNIGPSINFPYGVSQDLRIVSWTLKPPSAGPDVVEIETVTP